MRFVIFVVKIRRGILNILTNTIIILTTKPNEAHKVRTKTIKWFLLTHNARQSIVGKAIANLRLDWTLAAGLAPGLGAGDRAPPAIPLPSRTTEAIRGAAPGRAWRRECERDWVCPRLA